MMLGPHQRPVRAEARALDTRNGPLKPSSVGECFLVDGFELGPLRRMSVGLYEGTTGMSENAFITKNRLWWSERLIHDRC